MPARTTSFSLGADLDAYVREQVARGAYASASEVVRAALTRMAEEERREAALYEALDRGDASKIAAAGVWARVHASVRKRARKR